MSGLLTAVAAALIMPTAAPRGPVHVVVAPERFRDALRPYVEYRRRESPHLNGCLFLPLECATSRPGADEPERLKRCFYELWRRGGIASCLLVGDADVLPIRYMTLDRRDASAADWAFYPSDLYYADLAKPDGSFEDWNARRDGFHAAYYGEVHGESNKDGPINADRIDYRPEIAVGRWPVSEAAQIAPIVAKTIAFERDVRSNASAPGCAIFAVGGWVDVRDRVRRLAATLEPVALVDLRMHDSETPPPDAEGMRAALGNHPRFLLHTGHGDPNSYVGCLSLSTLAGISQPVAPVVFSIGCSTAEIATLAPYQSYVDTDGVEHAGTVLGERFGAPPPPPAPIQSGSRNNSSIAEELVRRADGGATAAIGCDTGAQPCAMSLLEGFGTALAEANGPTTLGEVWTAAIRHYVEAERLEALVPTSDWYPPSVYFQGMKFVVLGDPALQVR